MTPPLRRTGRSTASSRPRRPEGARGQSLVEFSLVLPLLLVLTFGLVEFAFVFNAVLTVNYASRDAALLAAEAGDTDGADCIILRAVEEDLRGPTDRTRVQVVDIYQADTDGTMIGTATSYIRTPGAPLVCTFADGTTVSVPYTATADGYPVASRCPVLAGCGPDNPELHLVGVEITYNHQWVTPLRSFVEQNPGGLTFVRSNVTRMEPVL